MNTLTILTFLLLAAKSGTTRVTFAPPNLRCTVAAAVRMDPITLAPNALADGTIYRFQDGRLMLKPTDRAEYEYGVLNEISKLQFWVGAKMVVFTRDDFATATVSHTHTVDVRVLRLSCRRER